jgi:hypothetical protein
MVQIRQHNVLLLRFNLLGLALQTFLLFFDQNLHSYLLISLKAILLPHVLALQVFVLDVVQKTSSITAAIR